MMWIKQTNYLALVGQQDWFTPGSKIIITTRLESLINAHENYIVYRPKKLSIDESLELFSWHAFGQKHPKESHMDLSKMFVQHGGGLPLALKVFGSSVRWKDTDVWESMLQKLEGTSDASILEKLEISFDSLKDNHDKNIFLDIACFFVGEKKKETITILDGCDNYSALVGIHNLVDRNLLTINIRNGTLEMHQLLQDMGKQIVCRESNYPEKRSRIWHPKESFNILREKTGTKKIEGLALDMNMVRNSNMVVFEANTFEKMYNLRLLKMTGVKVSGTYKAFPKRLQWLYWRCFPFESFPSDVPLENLVSLDLSYSNLNQVWKGTKVLGSLKILNLSHSSKLTKTPNFSRIPNLEKLVLKACPSLLEVDESIVKLQRIESLDLQDCKNLRQLPKNIGMIESLVEIDISGCSNLMGAMEELEKMKSLQVLKASGLMDINRVLTVEFASKASIWPWVPKPRVQMSLASLPSSLVRLDLSNCNLTDDAFPRDLKLSKLRNLYLDGNPISSLPNFIKDLAGLQTLDLSSCRNLQQILWPSTSTYTLMVDFCDALEKITFETGFYVGYISHDCCRKLNHIQGNFKVSPVREVDVELLNSIGFFNLDSMADVEAKLKNLYSGMYGDVVPIQILYQDHTFHAFFPGREVPQWFSKNGGSSISFTTTLSPHFGFRGLNLCAVYTFPDDLWDDERNFPSYFSFEISSKSLCKKTVFVIWLYGIPEKGGDMVWLSHCFKANLFT
ncbi:disease resistance protein RPV1-like [Rhododendron vialii]|uniref:disease resistance protein RPV1-like n=1 Tax=Rhododendron vialii TaxID=182163 RepID=UPI00265E737F|nr:disease resistance protein RPV1-like [Rhododendron vialii]XP_058190553.1 disease resistance protein RPV1-like [Rhododendron vialii]